MSVPQRRLAEAVRKFFKVVYIEVQLVVTIDYEVRSWRRWNVLFRFRTNAGFIRNRERIGWYP